ncbi:MAG: hydantoinase/carbamoylase family amidase, partial [Chloroflexi bacterium]|nr:hydantoinase/carbamoylase family amidase [Chloroflexota bacterium]
MESIGIDLSMLPAAERAPGSIKSVVELHIEQGPFLERAGKQIGVVTGVAGSTRFNCYVRGQQAHSGAMPMEGRRDALCGAAEILLAVERAASGRTEPRVVATVGYLDFNPRAVAIIPGRVHLIVDVRSVDPAACAEVVAEIKSNAESIAARRSLEVEWGPEWAQHATKLDPDVVATIAASCEELGVSHLSMISGGGHDAMTMAKRFPTAMLFVPSVGGISHAPEEFTRTDDLVTGARVLCRTLRKLAG